VRHSRIVLQPRAPYSNRIGDTMTNEEEITDQKEPLKNV